MKRFLVVILCSIFLCALQAQAAVPYLQDPVYVKINKDDEHPMDDLITLAQDGDARAQFILGDLYSKGKGGLAKNRVKARYWFEISARHGFTPAFIRLAALAKHGRDYIGAFQWYTLSAEHGDRREAAWSKSELQRLSRSLSRNAVAEAKQDAKDWLNAQRDAMRTILKNEETARNTLPAPDLGDDDKKTAEVKVKEPPATPKKEHHYNE